MAENSQVVVAPTTAVSNDHVVAIRREQLPALIWATGLTGADSVPIKITPDNGVTQESFFQDGSAVALTATNKGEAINAPMTIIIDKGVTSGTVGVFLNTGNHIGNKNP